MRTRKITKTKVERYCNYLREQEKSDATIEKYMRDIRKFVSFLEKRPVTKELMILYKESLSRDYTVTSTNSMLVAVNRFFEFLGWNECRVGLHKVQRRIFLPSNQELTKEEYYRLIKAAKNNGNKRLSLILQAIGSTGIRISELRYITIASLNTGRAQVSCKGKNREIFLPKELRLKLRAYARERGIAEGSIFVTKTGKVLNRSNVWKEMKGLCETAGVNPQKVFPHNLRHLFARCFYELEKDIVKLADILGHSNIETTRIYVISTGEEHERQIERLALVI